MLWGRGFRWMYYATGMPGWMRAGFGYPAFGGGNPFGFCRWFVWTSQGPILTSQIASAPMRFQPQMTKEQEIQLLEQEMKALEKELETIRNRLDELKKQK